MSLLRRIALHSKNNENLHLTSGPRLSADQEIINIDKGIISGIDDSLGEFSWSSSCLFQDSKRTALVSHYDTNRP